MFAFCFHNSVSIFVFPTLIPKNMFLAEEYTFKFILSYKASCNALLSRVFTMYNYISSIIYRCGCVTLSVYTSPFVCTLGLLVVIRMSPVQQL